MLRKTQMLIASTLLLAAFGCKKNEPAEPKADEPAAKEAPAEEPAKEDKAQPTNAEAPRTAKAVLEAKSGSKVSGEVMFTEADGKVKVVAKVSGLTPGKHGFHIHEKGDCSSDDGKSAGGHFNPGGHDHAGPDAKPRHAGDLGNIEADEAGNASHEVMNDLVTLGEGENSAMGKAVIIHADPDDLKSQPTGNAGARVACGVIK